MTANPGSPDEPSKARHLGRRQHAAYPMPPFAELHLKPDVLARCGLPSIAYPIAPEDLQSAIAEGGELPLPLMLYGLQQRAQDADAPWQDLEPAMAKLAELLAPDDDRDVLSAAGDTWWLEVGPIDLSEQVVTVQRGEDLIAGVRPRPDGRLRIAAFRPLDAKSASYLTGLAQLPDPVHGVCMRENNWQYALDCSGGMGNVYADQRGEAYLSYWQNGIGLTHDGHAIAGWHEKRALRPRPVTHVIAELGVHGVLSDYDAVAPT